MALLGRTGLLRTYSITPPLFAQRWEEGDGSHDDQKAPECDPTFNATLGMVFRKDRSKLPGTSREADREQFLKWSSRKDQALVKSGNLHWIRQWSPAARDCPRPGRQGRHPKWADSGDADGGGRRLSASRVKWLKMSHHITVQSSVVPAAASAVSSSDAEEADSGRRVKWLKMSKQVAVSPTTRLSAL